MTRTRAATMRAKVLVCLAIFVVPVSFLGWDIADLLADPKTERQVMGSNFLEDDLYARAVLDLIGTYGRTGRVLDVHVDLRSAQFSIVRGPDRATVEGFGERGGGQAYTRGGAVKDYDRSIAAGELETATRLGDLTLDAPARVTSGLIAYRISVGDVASMRLMRGSWFILVSTGPGAGDNRRFVADRTGSNVRPA